MAEPTRVSDDIIAKITADADRSAAVLALLDNEDDLEQILDLNHDYLPEHIRGIITEEEADYIRERVEGSEQDGLLDLKNALTRVANPGNPLI